MAKRIRSKYELIDFSGPSYRSTSNTKLGERKEFIERVVLPADTLQGLALLYNTTVQDIKKVNNILTDAELHAYRVIKVPSRGILVNLQEEPTPSTSTALPSSSTTPISVPTTKSFDGDEPIEAEEETNGQAYLENKDNLLKEIREKAEKVASISPILNGSETVVPIVVREKSNELKWWKVLLPCIGVFIGFPILYFIYREHLHDLVTSIPIHGNISHAASH